MKVKELIKELKKYDKNLEIRMFAHDHNSFEIDSGIGTPSSVEEITNENGETFIELHS